MFIKRKTERKTDNKGRATRSKLRKRPIKFVMPKDAKIDYKNLPLLQKFVTDRGKLLSRRLTGVSAKTQRDVTTAVKRARYLGLLSVGGAKK